jgi:hypothetical protein
MPSEVSTTGAETSEFEFKIFANRLISENRAI